MATQHKYTKMPSEKLCAVHKFKKVLGCYCVRGIFHVYSLQHTSPELAQNPSDNTTTTWIVTLTVDSCRRWKVSQVTCFWVKCLTEYVEQSKFIKLSSFIYALQNSIQRICSLVYPKPEITLIRWRTELPHISPCHVQ